MKNAPIVWTAEELEKYLVKPMEYVKGSKMAFAGVPKLVVATPNRESVCHRFPSLHPQLGQVAEVTLLELTPTEMARLELEKMPGGAGFDLAFVACQNDLDTLSLARHLTQQGLGMSGRIVGCLRPSTDLMRLLSSKQPVAGVELRDLVELGCRADVLLRGELDREARAIHENYLKSQTAAGATEATNSALVAWEPRSIALLHPPQAPPVPLAEVVVAAVVSAAI